MEQLGLDVPAALAEAQWRQRAALSDTEIDLSEIGEADDATAGELLAGSDAAGLVCEENTLRYRVVPELTIRLAAGGSRWDLLRVLNAAAGTLGVEQLAVNVAKDDGTRADYLAQGERSGVCAASGQRQLRGECAGLAPGAR